MSTADLARAGFDAFNRGDVDAILDLLHPDVEVYSSADVGESGTYHGHDGYLAWTRIWLDAWDSFEIRPDEVEQVDERNLLIQAHQRGRGKGSGVEVTQDVVYLFTVEGGLATRLHIYGNREQALVAATS